MINFPDPNELTELRKYEGPYCVSIYASSFDASGPTNTNQVELKKLAKQAEIVLSGSGISSRDLDKTLSPIKRLINNNRFWSRRSEGLALFLHSQFYRYYLIPGDQTPNLLTVSNSFNLEPILSYMADNRSFFVLALGHKGVQLYEGDRFHIHPVQLNNFPTNMDQALGYGENPKWHETHTIAPAVNGKGSEAYHGQYNISQVDKNMLEEFFRTIDRRLHRYLFSSHKPLILAGVNYLQPIYRKINTYSYLYPKGIKGNIEAQSPKAIQDKAWSLIKNGNTQS